MSIEVCVFILGESVIEVIVVIWFKKLGDVVVVDEMLCELEIDKVIVEVFLFVVGIFGEIVVVEGDIVGVDVLLVILIEGVGVVLVVVFKVEVVVFVVVLVVLVGGKDVEDVLLVKKLMVENNINCDDVIVIGKDGCVMKGDVLNVMLVLKVVFVVVVVLVVDNVVCEECVCMIKLC